MRASRSHRLGQDRVQTTSVRQAGAAGPIRQRVRHAIAGFLAGYAGTTLEAYRLDLRGWISWLDAAFVDPFVVERAHIELYARWCESEGKARSTIGRRRSTICTATAPRNA